MRSEAKYEITHNPLRFRYSVMGNKQFILGYFLFP